MNAIAFRIFLIFIINILFIGFINSCDTSEAKEWLLDISRRGQQERLTPFMVACTQNVPPIWVEWVLQQKTNINAQDENGDTALHWACCSKETPLSTFGVLLQCPEVNLNIQNNKGHTPLSLACVMAETIPDERINSLLATGKINFFLRDKEHFTLEQFVYDGYMDVISNVKKSCLERNTLETIEQKKRVREWVMHRVFRAAPLWDLALLKEVFLNDYGTDMRPYFPWEIIKLVVDNMILLSSEHIAAKKCNGYLRYYMKKTNDQRYRHKRHIFADSTNKRYLLAKPSLVALDRYWGVLQLIKDSQLERDLVKRLKICLIHNREIINYCHPTCGTLLHFYAQLGDVNIVNVLLDCRADPNVLDNYGNAPLHLASSDRIIFLLVESGANVDLYNSRGNTPLLEHLNKVSLVNPAYECIYALLRAKVDPNRPSSANTLFPLDSVLQIAHFGAEITQKFVDMVRALLEVGAKSYDISDRMRLAILFEQQRIVDLLLEYGTPVHRSMITIAKTKKMKSVLKEAYKKQTKSHSQSNNKNKETS